MGQKSGVGSWALLVCMVDEEYRHRVVCSTGDRISFDPHHCNFVGAEAIHSTTAECVAHLMVFMFLFQPCIIDLFQHFPIWVGYDNSAAADIAAGTSYT